MNIFVLDEDPTIASNLFDKHIVKMPLETAQILCSVAKLRGFEAPYRITHAKHPCVLWTAASSANWNWLCLHGIALSKEYTLRYKKVHKCQEIIQNMLGRTLEIWGENKHYSQHTPFVQCMPDQYKQSSTVEAYRAYYIGEKAKIANWKFGQPDWFKV